MSEAGKQMDGVGGSVRASDATREAEGVSPRQRDSLFMIAQMQVADGGDPIEVRVRNLSPGGLMIELDRMLAAGTAVALEMRGLGEVTGTIAWYTRGRAGIALDSPIDPKKVRKPVGGGTSTPDYAKPILMARPSRR